MAKEDSKSLGDEHTFAGADRGEEQSPQSLGDEATFAGGGLGSGTQSLGDQSTMGGDDAAGDVDFNDDMEIVDLAARYKMESVLGKGGMGEVLLATDTRLERKVAIKRMLGEAAGSRTAVNRFLTEAKSIAALNHPNIVQIFDYGRAPDGPFLIMEYVEGSSLLDRCRERALPLEEAVELTCQLCDGLAKAHDANIIHRDIKPANILLTADGLPKLTDFGLAKDEAADTGQTMAGAVLGTLDFMPPEQRQDATLTDARSDLWSLAATLYQMVTGKSPKVIRLSDVPQTLQEVLSKALEERCEQRFQTAREFRNALRAAVLDAVTEELEAGACANCNTRNPVDRSFCRNPDCGAPLRLSCLSCEAEIPVWEEICGSCGGKQSQLLDEYRKKIAAQQSQAEESLNDHDFAAARKLARQLSKVPESRLRHLRNWAEQFLEKVTQEEQTQKKRLSLLLDEALHHQEEFDYKAGIQTLEQIPAALRAVSVPGHELTACNLLERLSSTQQNCHRLSKTIQQRIAEKQLDGLEEHVDALLILKPKRQDLLKLKRVLTERQQKLEAVRDESILAAQGLMKKHDYSGCLEQLTRIDATLVSDEIVRLRQDAECRLARVHKLQSKIDAAVQSKQWHDLLPKVEECLTLQPDDDNLLNLQTRLAARDEKNTAQVAQIVEKASILREECRFEEACTALERIPERLLTDDISDLLDDFGVLAAERQQAFQSLEQAMQQSRIAVGLKACQSYRDLLEAEELKDDEFAELDHQCQQALQTQRKKAAAAVRHRKLAAILGVAAAGLMAVSLLIGAVLWLRASTRANAIAEALKNSDYDAVLALDSHNVSALIGRAKRRLSGKSPNIEGAFADLTLADQLGSDADEFRSIQADAYVNRALVQATAGNVKEAEADLQIAESLGSTDAQLRPLRNALADAHLAAGRKAAMKGDATAIRTSCDVAEQYGAALSDLNQLRAEAFRFEAEQKQKTGNTAGALADFEAAVKLDPGNSLLTERAALHTHLGHQAILQQDYETAAAALECALTLDKAADGVADLAAHISEPAISAFENEPSRENQETAVTAVRSVLQLYPDANATLKLTHRVIAVLSKSVETFEQNANPQNRDAAVNALSDIEVLKPTPEELHLLRSRVANALRTGVESLIPDDLTRAIMEYKILLKLDTDIGGTAHVKQQLAAELQTRCQQALDSENAENALTHYQMLRDLDAHIEDHLLSGFAGLPKEYWGSLPIQILQAFPPSTLSELPKDILLKMPSVTLASLPTSAWPTLYNSIGMKFKLLHGGTFTMGSESGEQIEGPPHAVTLTQPFALGIYEVTQSQYETVMARNKGRRYKGDDNPANLITYKTAVEFCDRMSALPEELEAGRVYRLPTEAEWEYACRAGTSTAYSYGDGEGELHKFAWYFGLGGGFGDGTHPVGKKRPNPWVFFDMHGNVSEWCLDRKRAYRNAAAIDPTGPVANAVRIRRGGSFRDREYLCRSAARLIERRSFNAIDTGFRVVMTSALQLDTP